jgi:hypothetical protein
MTPFREDLIETFMNLEHELLLPAVRYNGKRLAQLLHHDFVEIGKSGRRWDKETCIALLLAERHHPVTTITSMIVTELHRDGSLMLVEWTMPGVRRTSIWVVDPASGDGWQMLRHQGTPSAEV